MSFLVLVLAFTVGAQEKAEKKATFTYGGVATCKACHLTKKSGAQYKIWAKGPHAKAYETLGTAKAKEVGKKSGVEDPQKSEKCLTCHVTAYGVDAKLRGAKLTLEEGVSCEVCHGPGSAYKSRKLMKAIYEGKQDGAKYGLIKPTEETCVKCHNKESPTFTEFKFDEMVAKIAHPVPKESK
jgi:hypothetical protein